MLETELSAMRDVPASEPCAALGSCQHSRWVRELSSNFAASLPEGEGWKCFHFDGREKGSALFPTCFLKAASLSLCDFFFNFFKEKKHVVNLY